MSISGNLKQLGKAAWSGRTLFLQPKRNTWVLRHVIAPEKTLEGFHQRPPHEHPNLQKYEVVDFETKRAAGPLRVILLEDIEGIGHQFDIVDVNRKLARTDLLLSRKAVYVSPFDLKYYAEMKEKMKDELAARVRIPYDYLRTGRELMKRVIPLYVSMENSWTINRDIVISSLRLSGIEMTDSALFLPVNTLNGPNFEFEAKLIRFYVVICKQYIVPMVGRVSHISADDSKQVLYPGSDQAPSAEQLAKHGIREETPHYHKTADIYEAFDVYGFMQSRIGQ
ncbi:hypothetical protein QR680_009316 [Steinernema hermaphroditum]|uniref:Large ribosomal subunit protein bL9m n=1 Tax=Steinernema hermaphroditum TaxID=289476 RepID=A0AA39M976_9BILA|nr:hypothetical protein QR680_009316 [Steinernema hermaphroditum]